MQVSGLRLWPADGPTPPTEPAVGSQQGVWVTQPFAKGSVVAVVPLQLAVNVYKRDLLVSPGSLIACEKTELKSLSSLREMPYSGTSCGSPAA